ncbi:pseudouridine synthase [Lactarius sanguifluus]|nr:pseudouridine synthase [Lactarius sanguifluus]
MFHKVYSIEALGRTVGSLVSGNTHSRFRPSVLYADRGVIAVNKPPGLVSQGCTPGTGVGTDHNHHSRENHLDAVRAPYPVHRLDKGTTGVLMLACTKVLARELSQQFRTHAIGKTYLALVLGGSREFSAKKGLISRSLSSDNGRVKLGAEEGPGSTGKPALTMWEVLAFSDKAPLSLVRLYPRTGLKHQLRVHMAHTLQVPILGDTLYGNATSAQQILTSSRVPESRLFLHSSSISFWRYRRTGPRKRFRLTIVAPLPADFIKVCHEMGLQPPDIATRGGIFIHDVGGRWLGEPVSI